MWFIMETLAGVPGVGLNLTSKSFTDVISPTFLGGLQTSSVQGQMRGLCRDVIGIGSLSRILT